MHSIPSCTSHISSAHGHMWLTYPTVQIEDILSLQEGGERKEGGWDEGGVHGASRGCQFVFCDLGGWYSGTDLYSGSLLGVTLPPGDTG